MTQTLSEFSSIINSEKRVNASWKWQFQYVLPSHCSLMWLTTTTQHNVIFLEEYSGGFWDLSAAVNRVCKTFSLALTSFCNVVLSYLCGTPQLNQSRGYEASQPTFQWLHCWRAVVVFLGHLIRRWAPSMSCRSTSKATWQHLIVTTRRDTPGRCRAACSGQNSD